MIGDDANCINCKCDSHLVIPTSNNSIGNSNTLEFSVVSHLLLCISPLARSHLIQSLGPCCLPRRHRLICAYLSCKVDEFNVSSTQFVGNLLHETPAGQERALEQILEFELLLIQQLNFHLVIHTPYRPMEGLLIDLKVQLGGGGESCCDSIIMSGRMEGLNIGLCSLHLICNLMRG